MIFSLLLACDGGGPIDLPVEKAPDWLEVDGCLIPSGQSPTEIQVEEGSSQNIGVHGFVGEVGTGSPEEGCTSFGSWRLEEETEPDLQWWFTVTDEEQQKWTVGVQELGDEAAPRVGEEVHVEWSWREELPMTGQPGKSELHILDFEGAPIAWVGVGAGLSLFDPPSELSMSVGKELSRRTLDCYTEVAHSLKAQVGDSIANLDFGESANLGRYTVVHGGTVNAIDPTCSETMGSLTRIGMRR
jgi:hypothetical protein